MAKRDSYICVCAIDFGTTFSGYAFSFSGSANDIKMNKNWSGPGGFTSYKAPTCVLTDDKDSFIHFGFEAENEYATSMKNGNSKRYHLYRHFKMLLHNSKDVSAKSKVSSVDGKQCEALKIFSYALKYMKDHVLEEIGKNIPNALDQSNIRWVVTVPSIWSEGSKQFMREAAFKAEMIKKKDSEQLVIALEPEAASLCCRELEMTNTVLKKGTKYMVIDAGGGTVDITAHEVQEPVGVEELYAASGGAWGGTKVDANYEQLAKDVMGEAFIERYKTVQPKEWFKHLMAFETGKKAFNDDEDKAINVQLQWSMNESFRSIHPSESLESRIRRNGESHGVKFSNGNLVITQQAARKIFQPVLDKVIGHVKQLLEDHKEHSISYYFLVGGFSESGMFQKVIREGISKGKEVIPTDAQMAVTKGAVIFGHRPFDISIRIARRTYGCKVLESFIDGKHKESKKRDSYCQDIFHTLVEKGDKIEVREKKNHTFYTAYSFQQVANIQFHSIDHKARDPHYVDDGDVEKLGEGIMVQTPGLGAGREIILSLTFGGTEIKAEARDVTSGSTAETTLNFLSS